MSNLEFEQKFILDLRRVDELVYDMTERSLYLPGHEIKLIRQLYDDNGYRYRVTDQTASDGKRLERIYERENKRAIKLDVTYAINVEDPDTILAEEFNERWGRAKKRLQKIRHEIPGRYPDQIIMVDFFYTLDGPYTKNSDIYAVVAEVESMITSETETLYLDFSLPIYLEQYSIKRVDQRDPEMKIFRSANMVDTPESIKALRGAYSRLYEST